MKRKITLLAGICLALMLAAIPLAGACAPKEVAPGGPILWKFGAYCPPTSGTGPGYQWWGDEVEKRSNGRIVVKQYWSGSLVPAKEMLDGVKTGLIDVGTCSPGYQPSRQPLSAIYTLPFLATPRCDHSTLVDEEMSKLQPKITMWDKENAYMILQQISPSYNIMGNIPLRTVEDLKGVRVRCFGYQSEVFKSVGAVPMSVPAPDTYTALSTGVVDLVAGCGDYWMVTYKIFEAAKYYTIGVDLSIAGTDGLVNKDSWAALPQDLLPIFPELRFESSKRWQEDFEGPGVIKGYRDQFAEKGIELIHFPPEEKAKIAALAQPIHDSWVEEWKDIGAQEVYDAYIKARDKIVALYPDGVTGTYAEYLEKIK